MRTKFDPYAALASARAQRAALQAVATPATPDTRPLHSDQPESKFALVADVASVADVQSAADFRSAARVADVALVADRTADAEQWKDRAAVIAYDAGIPADWTDGFAKLLAMPPPADVSEDRWQLFIDDCGTS